MGGFLCEAVDEVGEVDGLVFGESQDAVVSVCEVDSEDGAAGLCGGEEVAKAQEKEEQGEAPTEPCCVASDYYGQCEGKGCGNAGQDTEKN